MDDGWIGNRDGYLSLRLHRHDKLCRRSCLLLHHGALRQLWYVVLVMPHVFSHNSSSLTRDKIIEYAIMYAFTPESFPGPHRGTGTGTAATLLRLGGLCASLIGTYTNFSVAPIYVSASLWVVVGLISFV